MVPPLPMGNNPRTRGRVNQNDITKTRARLGIGGDAMVAIVPHDGPFGLRQDRLMGW